MRHAASEPGLEVMLVGTNISLDGRWRKGAVLGQYRAVECGSVVVVAGTTALRSQYRSRRLFTGLTTTFTIPAKSAYHFGATPGATVFWRVAHALLLLSELML